VFDIITFGSATRDIFVRSEELKIIESKEFLTGKALAVGAGEKVNVEELVFSVGGCGINTAVTFALQGLRVAYVGLIGHDLSGREIMRELNRLGVACDFVKFIQEQGTSASIILSAPGKPVPRSLGGGGERSILVYKGASHLLSEENIPWEKMKESNWFYVAGLAGESAKTFASVVSFAKENNIKLAVNPGRYQLNRDLEIFKTLLDRIDILLVNQEEASKITGIDFKKEEEIFKKFDELVPGIAVMTKGKEGVVVSDGKNIYRAGIPNSGYADRTGAGDAFGSGFVSGMIEKNDIEYAIQLATANATSCVQQIGATNGLLKKGEWGEWGKVKVEKKQI
jgi:sugar/nucleoside kinase (ribokinase family)